MSVKTKEQYRAMIEGATDVLEKLSKMCSQNAEVASAFSSLELNDQSNALRIMMQVMDEGSVKIEVKRSYWIFWRQGAFDLSQGYDEADALRRAGYGGGASAAIDFVSAVPVRSQAVTQRIALPDWKGDDAELFGHYKAQTLLYIDDLKRSGAEQDAIDDVLEEAQDQLKHLQFIYPDREFTKSYAEMYNGLFLKYGKLKTGIAELDKHLADGLRPGDFTVISVPTHAGASTLSTRLALEMAAEKNGEKKSNTPILDGLRDALKDVPKGFLP